MIRFTETNKWDDPWFRGLQGAYKLVFLYIVDRCNNAGFWEVDMDSIAYHTKLKPEHISGAIQGLNRGLIEANGWVWVRRFLRHQKNEPLNIENNAHKQIVSLVHDQIERFKDSSEFQEFLGANKGLASPPCNSKGKGKKGVQGKTETDEDWISGLEKKDCYRAVNIRAELEQAQTWCEMKGRKCTRQFFFNWLSKALQNARTITVNGTNVERKPASEEWRKDWIPWLKSKGHDSAKYGDYQFAPDLLQTEFWRERKANKNGASA